MEPLGNDLWRAELRRRPRSAARATRSSLDRPLLTWRDEFVRRVDPADILWRAGRRAMLMVDAARARRGDDRTQLRGLGEASARSRDADAGQRIALDEELDRARDALSRPPLRRAVSSESSPCIVDPRARALQRLVRALPALDARREPGQARHASRTATSACPTSPRWASTSSTCRRSIRSAASTARARTTRSSRSPATSAAPGRSAPAKAATRAIHPELGTLEDFRASSRPRASTRHRDRARHRVPVRARPSVCHASIPSGSATRPDGTLQYAENPPKKYQDIYPVQLRERRLARRCGRS